MKKLYSCFRYVGYIACATLLGWLSSLGGEENDYILKISVTFIPVLLTLIALTTTLTGLMLSELYKFKAKFNIEINQTVDELKRNVIIQIGIVAGAFVFFACKEAIIIFLPCFNNYANVTQNSIVAFAFMYFVLVIADTSMGLYNLIKKNSE